MLFVKMDLARVNQSCRIREIGSCGFGERVAQATNTADEVAQPTKLCLAELATRFRGQVPLEKLMIFDVNRRDMLEIVCLTRTR